MNKLKPREAIILVVTLILASVFGIYQFIVKPLHEGDVDINERLRLEAHELVKASNIAAQKSTVDAKYKQLVDLIGSTDSDDAQMPTIISKIENAAHQANIHIGNIQPQKPFNVKETTFLTVELEIDGQWLDIVQFLYMLQEQPNYYFINELNLEKYSDSTNSLRGRIVVSRMCINNPST